MTGSFRNPLGEKGVVYDCTYLKESYQKDGDILYIGSQKEVFNTHKSFFCNPPMKYLFLFHVRQTYKKNTFIFFFTLNRKREKWIDMNVKG